VRQLSVFKDATSKGQRCPFRLLGGLRSCGNGAHVDHPSATSLVDRGGSLPIDHHQDVVLGKRVAESERIRLVDRADLEAE
jgi:hypothetical protein